MNLNGDEKRIQQLFRDMNLDDQRRTPHFASVLAAARSGKTRTQNSTRSLRLAMAVALLCLVMLMAIFVVLKPSKPRGAASGDQALVPPVQPEASPSAVPSHPSVGAADIEAGPTIAKRARHRRASNSLENAMRLLSSWQSPTASLLQTPGDELLRSLPRLGESLKTMKSFSLDQFN